MTTTSETAINTNRNRNGHGLDGVAFDGDEIVVCFNDDQQNGSNDNSASNFNANNNNNYKKLNTQINNPNNLSNELNAAERAPIECTKPRKKLKSRNAAAAAPPHRFAINNDDNDGYTKEHLDSWLENCLKDATNEQLSSSSEFLYFNPKPMFGKQQQQQQQGEQQQQQQVKQQKTQNSQQKQMPQQQHQQQQQPYMLRSNMHAQNFASGSSMVAPNIFGSTLPPFSLGVQRQTPSYMKSSNSLNSRYPMLFPATANSVGSSGGGGGYFNTQNAGSQDFASLPPIVNMLGNSSAGSGNGNMGIGSGVVCFSENEHNSTDALDGTSSNPNISRGFRFSDPCLLNPSDNDSKISGQNTPNQQLHNNDMDNNAKIFATLIEQMNILHETNSKICRNLHETKVDIEALKHTPSWGGMRHRRDSLSGLSTQSQPMVFGGGFGTQSPAPTFHSAYTPGMMTDVVREVKEAARVREDALLNRVKTMVEERQWSMNEGNARILRDIDELKTHVMHLRMERKETQKRLNHLESENRYMRQLLASLYNNRNAADIIYENEALHRPAPTRKPFPQARRTQSFNLQYGTIHQQPVASTQLVDDIAINDNADLEDDDDVDGVDDDDVDENVLQSNENCTSTSTTSTLATTTASTATATANERNSLRARKSSGKSPSKVLPNGNVHQTQPNFALISSTPTSKAVAAAPSAIKVPQSNEQQNPSDNEQLKHELQEAKRARENADQRIIALEKLVRNLSVAVAESTANAASTTTTTRAAATETNSIINNGGGGGGGVGKDCYNLRECTTNIATKPNWSYHYASTAPITTTSISMSSTATPFNTNKNSNSNYNAQITGSPPRLSFVAAGPITDL